MRRFLSQLFTDIRSLPASVHVMIGGQFINRFGAFVNPFLALYLTTQGITLDRVALVLGSVSLGGLFGPVASGYLADAIGRRNTIVVALVTGALTTVALYHCRTVPQLLLNGFLHGFCSFLYSPAANALLTDLVTPAQRAIAFSLMRFAINAGFAAGPSVAGLLFGRNPMWIFYGDALTTLVFAGLAVGYLPHGLRTVSGSAVSPRVIWQSWCEALAHMVRNRPFVFLVVASLLMEISFVQTFNVLALTTVARGLTPAQYGVVMGLNGALIAVIELPLIQWVRDFEHRRVLFVGFALIGLGCAAFGLMRTQGGFFAAMTLFTVGEMLSLPISMSYVSTLAPEKYRGRYFGTRGMAWAFAGLAGSAGIWGYGRWGDTWWLLAGGCSLVGALLMGANLLLGDRPATSPAPTAA